MRLDTHGRISSREVVPNGGTTGRGVLCLRVAFATFASWSASDSMRETWNRLGFLVSAIAFALHIGYEHFRLRTTPLITAFHVSLAVAIGALLWQLTRTFMGTR
jgi:hypothetical protein